MGFGPLSSPAVNRLIFILYVLVILAITVSTPTQRLTARPGSPYPDLAMQDPTMIASQGVDTVPEASVADEASATGPETAIGDPEAEPVVRTAVNATPRAAVSVVAAPRAPRPVPTPPPDVVPAGTPVQFKDPKRRQIVSVALRDFAVQSQYTYYYDDIYSPDLVTTNAGKGNKFILVGIIWELVSVVGEGSRTTFRTPGTSSYTLFHEGQEFDPVNPGSLADPMHLYIRDHGTLAMERTIDKDNPGSGILIFEVPGDFTANDAYLQYCPNSATVFTGPDRMPGEGGCATRPVRWMLTR